ncbi:hypothetical protein TREMEDRAFT_60798 [Tremella mesenterica DSM 1558]|uniref:uncharacterized protein n=1 Tax=Tremella mesenterica (strain ATCC 24925 / CBS 8224 / DSM 1558 / NBRC 9311 / NRRL Y-6157 / RJB 2259-6 / UBC 559-6) TaxID=578456 RepID=UPI0003F49124|nr:uncharacterized protein TREMEDRAFT_60798 [Tremella mesenterica DSM 1558]EIW71875.1 hypothetical protein TREMEDRAFT_60798 [Tremella mesenterica DSM 1558]
MTPSLLKTPNSQGHATDKASSLHGNKNVQSASVQGGREAKEDTNSGTEHDEPFDAARQAGQGGQSKPGKQGKGAGEGEQGSMKDQVGGQGGGGVVKGGNELASGGSIGDSIKNTFSRSLHTSSFLRADINLHGDQNPHLKHSSPSSKDTGKGNAGPNPTLPSHKGTGTPPSATDTNEKSPLGTKKKEKEGEKPGTRSLHTSTRKEAKPPGGYARGIDAEPKRTSGYDVPQEALPANLSSPYASEAAPPPEKGMTPSSDLPYSSTATDPPNEVLATAAKEGTLGERNPQPSGDIGKLGNDEAWKHRK